MPPKIPQNPEMVQNNKEMLHSGKISQENPQYQILPILHISSVLRYFGPANPQKTRGCPVQRDPGTDPTLCSAMHGESKIP